MKIAVTAPRGKMGRLIVQSAAARPEFQLCAVIAPPGSDYLGEDAGYISGVGKSMGVSATDNWASALKNADVLIDFSTVQTSRQAVAQALVHQVPIICGTTGFTAADWDMFRNASESIPVLPAANTSRVIFLMKRLLEDATAELYQTADIEIVEMHSRDKLDAPSGTSMELGKAICAAAGKPWADTAVFGRKGAQLRTPGELGYHSIRSGDISSSHTVMFGLLGERLEITHHAHNWRCFAEGALDCAAFLHQMPRGLYSIEDVFSK